MYYIPTEIKTPYYCAVQIFFPCKMIALFPTKRPGNNCLGSCRENQYQHHLSYYQVYRVFQLALTHFEDLFYVIMEVSVYSWGLDIWVSSTSFQTSDIGWPQQPPTEKVLKFNMIFHDSTKKYFLSKHQYKDKFYTLDDSEVLSSD